MSTEEPSALMAARDSAKHGWPLGQVTVAALVEMIDRANDRAITAEATIARVRELHKPSMHVCECGENHGEFCQHCIEDLYPCPTIQALDGGV